MSEKLKQHLKILNESRRKPSGWQCSYCSNTFLTRSLMYEHMHVSHPEKCNKAVGHKRWQCEYCKAIFKNRKELFEHYRSCNIKLSLPRDSKGRVLSQLKSSKQCFCKFCNREFTDTHSLSYHEKLCKDNPEKVCSSWQGRKHKASSRIKAAETARRKLDEREISFGYNPIACDYMDNLNVVNGWHLQHALNGGEIRCGPYSLDGYDKEKNIIFEYDEPYHEHPKYREHDMFRQKYLIDTLKPSEFWRYSVKFDRLYRVV